jgi:hypothetical protein
MAYFFQVLCLRFLSFFIFIVNSVTFYNRAVSIATYYDAICRVSDRYRLCCVQRCWSSWKYKAVEASLTVTMEVKPKLTLPIRTECSWLRGFLSPSLHVISLEHWRKFHFCGTAFSGNYNHNRKGMYGTYVGSFELRRAKGYVLYI